MLGNHLQTLPIGSIFVVQSYLYAPPLLPSLSKTPPKLSWLFWRKHLQSTVYINLFWFLHSKMMSNFMSPIILKLRLLNTLCVIPLQYQDGMFRFRHKEYAKFALKFCICNSSFVPLVIFLIIKSITIVEFTSKSGKTIRLKCQILYWIHWDVMSVEIQYEMFRFKLYPKWQ